MLDLLSQVTLRYGLMSSQLRDRLYRLFIHRPDHWFIELLRSVAASLAAAVADYTSLILLVEFAMVRAVEASVVGVVLGHIITYVINSIWIFPGRDHGYHKVQFVLFVSVGASGLVVHTVLMYIFAEQLSVHYVIAKTISVIAMFLWGFLMRRLSHRYLVRRMNAEA